MNIVLTTVSFKGAHVPALPIPKFTGSPQAAPVRSMDTVSFSSKKQVGEVTPKLIEFDPKSRTFKLQNKHMSYVFQVDEEGDLLRLHWGASVSGPIQAEMLPYQRIKLTSWQNAKDAWPRAFPDFGRGDNRIPAVKVVTANGTSTSQFKYVGHKVLSGKPALKGLPSLYVNSPGEAQTLVVKLRDEATQLESELNFTVFRELPVVVRSARLINRSDQPVTLKKLASISEDFEPGSYKLMHLPGTWAEERQEETVDLSQFKLEIASRAGASGHEHNPFVALLDKDTTEQTGNAYGFSLVYSGSFSAEAEQNRNRSTRLVMGLNPDVLEWKLMPGESFQTPEAVGVFSKNGIGGMSQVFHDLFSKHLIRSVWKDKPRPVLLNSWETLFLKVNHETLVEFAREAKKMGVEMVVLDDGWFGGKKHPRNDFLSGLGDWTPDPVKFPSGLDGLAKDLQQEGVQLGLWVEPEMVSGNSELYRKHPDWVLAQPGRNQTPMRNQYTLDLGRKDVQDYIIRSMSRLLDSGKIQYVKWDMNRTMSDVGSKLLPPDRQGEVQHRYMLGLYRVLETLTRKYPNVLWEGCAGGGGRFDPGMLQYFPQIWASDNTDADSRLDIQAGTARVYPPMTMTAHVTDPDKGIMGRSTSLKFRLHTAMSANMGLELDPRKLKPEEQQFVKAQIGLYKQFRHLLQQGDYHLLRSPFNDNHPAWMYASKRGDEAVVFAFRKEAQPWGRATPSIRLQGLQEDALYQVSGLEQPVSGGFLMSIGMTPSFQGDYDSNLFLIKKVG